MKIALVAFGLVVCASSSLVFADNSKQDAKRLYDQAVADAALDQSKSVSEFCEAARLQPGNSTYKSSCQEQSIALLNSDRVELQKAHEFMNAGDLKNAAKHAHNVSSFSPVLVQQVKTLLAQIDEKSKAPQTMPTIVPPPPPPQVSHTEPNPQPASNSNTSPEPSAQQTAHSEKPKAPNGAPDDSARMRGLLDTAKQALDSGNLQVAKDSYGTVLQAHSENKEAKAGLSHVLEQEIRLQPQKLNETLVAAIRYFYDSNFPQAQARLETYLDVSEAPNKGAAQFYLGATLLEQSILDSPTGKGQAVPAKALEHFREAKKSNYQPVSRLVSPIVMNAWSQAGM